MEDFVSLLMAESEKINAAMKRASQLKAREALKQCILCVLVVQNEIKWIRFHDMANEHCKIHDMLMATVNCIDRGQWSGD